jgi:CubicO group peptidase (beta-lactamase class C family)
MMESNPPSERYYASGMLWGYGYLWWLWEDHHTLGVFTGAYSAQGNGGQYITVLPAIDLVVAHKRPFELAGLNAGRGVRHQQFQAALYLLTNARCREASP